MPEYKQKQTLSTEKEIMMRIYDSMQDILRNQARTEEKVDGISKIIDRQQAQIDAINQVSNKQDQLEHKVEQLTETVKKFDDRLEVLEQRAGKVALTLWKKIGGIVISVIVTATITGLIGHFMAVGK